MVTAGVLALQGAFREHARLLTQLGAQVRLVRRPEQLAGLDALVLPGGESTAMVRLAAPQRLMEAVRVQADSGVPMLGTCAGLILLADRVLDAQALAGLPTVGGLQVAVRRNAYGAQLASGERQLQLVDGSRMTGVFIRAPRIESVGPDVRVLGECDGVPVLVQQGNLIGAAFHPELSGDDRLHRLVLELADERSATVAAGTG